MTNGKSVLFISNLTSQMNRGTSVSETIGPLLAERGWKVYLASGKENRFLRLLDMIRTTWKNKDDFDVAIIEVFSGNAFIWAEVIGNLLYVLHKPFSLGLYGGNLPEFTMKNRRRVNRLLNKARYVFAPSTYLISRLSSLVSRNIDEMHYGVDLTRFQFSLRDHPKPRLISLRGFHQIYCPWVAAEVVALLQLEYPEVYLIMSGGTSADGSLMETIKRIDHTNIQSKVKITGYVKKPELESLVRSSDILLNTPIIDNTPVSVIQAMSSGLCVVSTNVGGIPYMLEDGIDALLVPPNDPQAMAAAVKRILTEPGLAEKLSTNARKKAEQFDWSVILPQWEELIEKVIENSHQ